jgi:hypothetical protein
LCATIVEGCPTYQSSGYTSHYRKYAEHRGIDPRLLVSILSFK